MVQASYRLLKLDLFFYFYFLCFYHKLFILTWLNEQDHSILLMFSVLVKTSLVISFLYKVLRAITRVRNNFSVLTNHWNQWMDELISCTLYNITACYQYDNKLFFYLLLFKCCSYLSGLWTILSLSHCVIWCWFRFELNKTEQWTMQQFYVIFRMEYKENRSHTTCVW